MDLHLKVNQALIQSTGTCAVQAEADKSFDGTGYEFSVEGVPELRRRKVDLHLKVNRPLIQSTGTAEADESVGVTGNESKMLHRPEQLFGVEK